MKIDQFLRVYALRAPTVMWFLGAGASASAGIITAYSMIWEFKRAIYCSKKRVAIQSCPSLADENFKAKIQAYFDEAGGYPPFDGEAEYSHYFEESYPAEADRRNYINRMIKVGEPSFGHRALAILLKEDKARMVWTTNFDTMIEDAFLPLHRSSGDLVLADLGEPSRAVEAMNEGRFPLVVKMHGDFRSRRLKNTTSELQKQDETMRYGLVEGCKRFGLAVCGYSGRDHSIMEALEQAIDGGRGYPNGLFWFARPNTPVLPKVKELIERASSAGVDAHIVEVDTFDELLGDVVSQTPDIPLERLDYIGRKPERLTPAPLPALTGTTPVIRLNALPITASPTVCRLVRCKIGGTKQVREAVQAAGNQVIAVRRTQGVICFGKDAEVRKAFGGHHIDSFDLHPVEEARLSFESAEHGLLYDALTAALRRERPFLVERRGPDYMIMVDPKRSKDPVFNQLRAATGGQLIGQVGVARYQWAEAIRIRLDHRVGRFWLLIDPSIWFERRDDEDPPQEVKDFVRNRTAARHNAKWHEVFLGWVAAVVPDSSESTISAFGIGDGIDAAFTISRKVGSSLKEVSR